MDIATSIPISKMVMIPLRFQKLQLRLLLRQFVVREQNLENFAKGK